MRLAAEQITGSGCLLGGEIALLFLGNLEEGGRRGLALMAHIANIQETCISMQ
jgi:hypothetical protein